MQLLQIISFWYVPFVSILIPSEEGMQPSFSWLNLYIRSVSILIPSEEGMQRYILMLIVLLLSFNPHPLRGRDATLFFNKYLFHD